MGNSFSFVVMLSALPIGLLLSLRFGFAKVFFGYIFAAQLFLPEIAIDVPVFIPIGKRELIGIFALITIYVLRRRMAFSGRFLALTLAFLASFGIIVTNGLNPDTVFKLGSVYPGVSLYEGLSFAVRNTLLIAPYLAGILIFSSEKDIENILKWLAFLGIIYSITIWYEARMSPQLHTNIYGFFQHDFIQHMRQGSFRPIVFLPHGLHVAFFAMLSLCALLILLRARVLERSLLRNGQLAIMGISVFLCKSLGSILFMFMAVPLLWLGSRRVILTVALMFAIVAITFPITRSTGIFPADTVLEAAAVISEQRSNSLGVRFDSEDLLIEHAKERPIWGWGTSGRNGVVVDGRSLAIFDGFWIILIGTSGWVGFATTFGLLLYPIVMMWRLGGRPEVPFTVIGSTLLVAINMVELLPNTTMGPWTWLLAGSITGYAITARRQIAVPPEPETMPARPRRRTII